MATRKIFNDTDMAKFLESSAKKDLLRFTTAMGRSVASFPDERTLSPPLACLEAALQTMLAWRTTVPPHDDENIRFGNPAFREWHERLVERAPSIVTTVLECTHETDVDQARESGRAATTVVTESDDPRVLELCSYLQAAFGHPVRLDYGTGHESSFQVFLWCLCQLGCVSTEQPPSAKALSGATLSLYSAYLNVTRQLQTDYRLEPAGSHGVWGLDDYHCIPFYLGACQLQSSEYMPESIHDARVLNEESEHYLYFACIRYIKSLKKGVPFFEHSPMLDDISRLPSWTKVSTGLLKLYEGEVLKKRPVVQHFTFGELFAADWEPTGAPVAVPETTWRETTKAPWAK